MQREKLYSLQNKLYFNCILCVFNRSKTLCDHFSLLRKNHFFLYKRRKFFFLLQLLSSNTYYLKTKYTKRYSVKSSTIYKKPLILIVCFLFSKFCVINFHRCESWSHRIWLFLKQKVYNENKLFFVNYRTFHAASYGIFVFWENVLDEKLKCKIWLFVIAPR